MPQNMSHCRFSNTFEAMRECNDYLEEFANDPACASQGLAGLSPAEREAAYELMDVSVRFIRNMENALQSVGTSSTDGE